MAHIGEEFGFGPAGDFRFLARVGKFHLQLFPPAQLLHQEYPDGDDEKGADKKAHRRRKGVIAPIPQRDGFIHRGSDGDPGGGTLYRRGDDGILVRGGWRAGIA